MPEPAWTVVSAKASLRPGLRELWEYRELLAFFAWRDIKVRYQQTAIGVAWIGLQPMLLVAAFSLVFGMLLRVPSHAVPYSLFVFAGLLPWHFFAAAVGRSAVSIVANAPVLTKAYFPRLIVPISTVLALLVDFAVSLVVFAALFMYQGCRFRPTWLLLPLLVLWTCFASLAVGVWLAALNVKYRDVAQAVPVGLQLWMYATPIVYPSSMVPAAYRPLLVLNPLATISDAYRYVLFGIDSPLLAALPLAISIVGLSAVFVAGLDFFGRTERTFADIV